MDFTQSMDNGYMIPTSVAVGSGEATDIRCVCDTVEDFKTFLNTTGMELRYEGLVTYEKVNKLLKVYKGDNVWQVVGEGGGNVDTSNFITLTQLSQQLNSYYTKVQTDNKITVLDDKLTGFMNNLKEGSNFICGVTEWNCLGDSITDGFGVDQQYHKILQDKYNIPIVNNYGISSSEIAVGGSGGNPMCIRYAEMSDTADLVTVFGGVNDLLHNIPLGSFSSSNQDASNFYGALNILCSGLIEKFPSSTIIFFTPIKHSYTGVTGVTANGWNSSGLKLESYIEAIKEVCGYYSIPVIDLNNTCGMNFNIPHHRTTYSRDGLHPNEKGHLKIAMAIEQKYSFSDYTSEIDNDNNNYGNIIVSTNTVSVDENSTSTFTVKLDKAPTNTQIVNISVNNAYCTLDKTKLTFTPNDYSVAQTVTVTGVHDKSSYSNESSVITISSANVSSKNISVTINNIDTTNEIVNVQSVSLDRKTYTMNVNETVQLTPIIVPSNATNQSVTWEASNGNCTVVNGLVTAISEGECVITCKVVGSDKMDTCNLTIVANNENVPVEGKIYLYNTGDKCEAVTGGFSTAMVTFNSDNFKISHSAGGVIKTVNTFNMKAGDKVCVKVISCDGANDAYELRLLSGSDSVKSTSIGTMRQEIADNGFYLLEYEYAGEKNVQLGLGNYFGNFSISEWYIERNN